MGKKEKNILLALAVKDFVHVILQKLFSRWKQKPNVEYGSL